jgi:hypothetical protein
MVLAACVSIRAMETVFLLEWAAERGLLDSPIGARCIPARADAEVARSPVASARWRAHCRRPCASLSLALRRRER